MVLSYKHVFHAGNFADVHKHSLLALLLHHPSLHHTTRRGPLTTIDTHSGSALYQLSQAVKPNKKAEYSEGIASIYSHQKLPATLVPYVSTVKQYNQLLQSQSQSQAAKQSRLAQTRAASKFALEERDLYQQYRQQLQQLQSAPTADVTLPTTYNSIPLVYYPGSPLLTLNQCHKPADHHISCELHPNEYNLLKQNLQHLKQLKQSQPHLICHKTDGFEYLRHVKLPAGSGQVVVLVDPPYEDKSDYKNVVHTLTTFMQHYPTAICLVWIPLFASGSANASRFDFRQQMRETRIAAEFGIYVSTVEYTDAAAVQLQPLTGYSGAASPQSAETDKPVPAAKGLIGSAMLCVNPPHLYEQQATHAVKSLTELVNSRSTGDGKQLKWASEWLRRE